MNARTSRSPRTTRSHNRRHAKVTTLTRHRRARSFGTIADASEANQSLLQHVRKHGKADLVIADYPWKMGVTSGHLAKVSPEAHYPTMAPKALLDFDLDTVCAKDAVIGFWALVGQMPLAYKILERYGFKARTAITWSKVRANGGAATIPTNGCATNTSEIFIVAHRGKGLPLNRLAKRFRTVMIAERRGHSQKPEIFRELLTDLYRETRSGRRVRRVELFARTRHRGWKVWGNQAPQQVGGKALALR